MDSKPIARRDLEFFPLQHGGQQLILIRDHLGLVQEGRRIAPHLYQLLSLLDGTKTIRDLQMELIRQQGGVLIGSDEVERLLIKMDEFFLLDSEKFQSAKREIEAHFATSKVRTCCQCGRAYPSDPKELRKSLDAILASRNDAQKPQGKLIGLVSPHIDPSAGVNVYASAYQMIKSTTPQRVIVLGIGHHMPTDLFCLTDKEFETPFGVIKNEPDYIRELREFADDIIATNDFAHRSEHSIEFQMIFLQHLLAADSFTVIPILCGSLLTNLSEYNRGTYLKEAGPFLKKLKQIVLDSDRETLVVAGVDFSHIGLKFGHEMSADYLENQTESHDRNLLTHLTHLDSDQFWQESVNVKDRFNVCGFPALACLLEILPDCKGTLLDYQLRHEAATQSAVSFAAVAFTSQNRK
jgi:AmmeMemoRadiSam system protein B